MDLPRLETILSRYEGETWDLIPVLQDIQDSYSYLPKDELQMVAERLQVPLTLTPALSHPTCLRSSFGGQVGEGARRAGEGWLSGISRTAQ